MDIGHHQTNMRILAVDIGNQSAIEAGKLVALHLDDRIPYSRPAGFQPDYVVFFNSSNCRLDLKIWEAYGLDLDLSDLSERSRDLFQRTMVRSCLEAGMSFKTEFAYSNLIRIYPNEISLEDHFVELPTGRPEIIDYDLASAKNYMNENSLSGDIGSILRNISSITFEDDVHESFKEAVTVSLRPKMDIHFRELLSFKDTVLGKIDLIEKFMKESELQQTLFKNSLDESNEKLQKLSQSFDERFSRLEKHLGL